MIYFIYFVCYLTREAYFLRYLMLCTPVCAWFSATLYPVIIFGLCISNLELPGPAFNQSAEFRQV